MTAEYLRATESQTYRHRLLALLAIAAAGYFESSSSGLPPFVALVPAVLGYLIYGVVLHRIVLPRFYHPLLVYGMMAADVLFATIIIIIFGPASYLFLLFPLIVINHSFYLGYTGSLASATVLSAVTSAVALASAKPDVLPLVAFRIPLLYLVAIFVGYLARERFKERDARLALQEVLRAEQKGRDLLGLADSLARSVDIESLLKDIAAAVLQGSGAVHSLVYLREGEHDLRLRASASAPGQPALEAPALLRNVTESRESAVRVDGELPPWAKGCRLLMDVPLVGDGGWRGMLEMCFDADRGIEEREETAVAISRLASAALRQADLILHAREQGQLLLKDMQSAVSRMGRFRESAERKALAVGELRLNPVGGEVSLEGEKVALTQVEFDVLYLLADKAGLPVGKEVLFGEVWGEKAEASNVVDVTVHRLRRKLEGKPGGKGLIETVRGQGYRLRSSK